MKDLCYTLWLLSAVIFLPVALGHTGETEFKLNSNVYELGGDPNNVENIASFYIPDSESWEIHSDETLDKNYISFKSQATDLGQIPSLIINYDSLFSPPISAKASYEINSPDISLKVTPLKSGSFLIADNYIKLEVKIADHPCKKLLQQCSFTISSWMLSQLINIGAQRPVPKLNTVISSNSNIIILNSENGLPWFSFFLNANIKQKLGRFVNVNYYGSGLAKLDFSEGCLYLNFKKDLATTIFSNGILKQQLHVANVGSFNSFGELIYSSSQIKEKFLTSDEHAVIWQSKAIIFERDLDEAIFSDSVPKELFFEPTILKASTINTKGNTALISITEMGLVGKETTLIYSKHNISENKDQKADLAVTVDNIRGIYLINDGFYFIKSKNGLYYLSSSGKSSPTSFTDNGDEIVGNTNSAIFIKSSVNGKCMLRVLSSSFEHPASFNDVGINSPCFEMANFSSSHQSQLISTIDRKDRNNILVHVHYNLEK